MNAVLNKLYDLGPLYIVTLMKFPYDHPFSRLQIHTSVLDEIWFRPQL
jgi:hypothetical protein